MNTLPNILVSLTLLLFITTVFASAVDVCPLKPRTTKCLPSLTTEPQLYAPCLTSPCYLFLSERPFVRVPNPPPAQPYLPFTCSSPAPFSGLTFDLHRSTPEALCIYAGPDCSFNDLVHFIHDVPPVDCPDGVSSESGKCKYQFAISGLLIQTPQRLCAHSPSSSFIEDAMVIIGHTEANTRIQQLVRPFSSWTWVVVILCLVFIGTVSFSIAFSTRGKASIAGALFVAAGDSSSLLRGSAPGEAKRASFSTRHTIAMTLLKASIGMMIAVLALFYEAGVVNFLFQQNTAGIGKHVRSLSIEDLKKYAVLGDSALEQVWDAIVNPEGKMYNPNSEEPPWQRCVSSDECIRWVADPQNDVKFVITFGISARYLIQQLSSCESLTVFTTKDILYHFSGGWLYNDAVPSDYRQLVDRMIIGLRINRTIGRLFEEKLNRDACAETVDPQLGPFVVMVPICLVVLPPLIASAAMLFFIRKKEKAKAENHDLAVSSPSPVTASDSNALNKTISVDMSQVSGCNEIRKVSTKEMDANV